MTLVGKQEKEIFQPWLQHIISHHHHSTSWQIIVSLRPLLYRLGGGRCAAGADIHEESIQQYRTPTAYEQQSQSLGGGDGECLRFSRAGAQRLTEQLKLGGIIGIRSTPNWS